MKTGTLKSRHKVLALLLTIILMIGMMPVVTSASEDGANSLDENLIATPGSLASPTNAGISPAAAGLYNVGDIAVINNIITTNWSNEDTKPELAPTDGSYVPDSWWSFVNWSSDTGTLRVSELRVPRYGLTGALDLRDLDALTYLDCGDNQLTKIDVSGCSALTGLTCANNQLTELKVSGCTALDYLRCENNQLTELDMGALTALESLTCYSNQLTELDVSDKAALTSLICGENKLTTLDVGNLTSLTRLRCYSNKLTSLDVSNLIALTNLSCQDNQLTELDVSNSPAMTSLRVSGNKLTELDLYGLDYINDYSFNRQSASFNLTVNAQGSYSLAVPLNNPTFGNSAISYADGVLTSAKRTVNSTSFEVQTNISGFTLSGTLRLNYSDSTATPGTTTPTNPSRPSGNNDNRGSGSNRDSSSSYVSTGPVNVTSAAATTAVNSALTAAKAAGASTATANIKNPGDISLSTLKAIVNQAGATPLKLQADSMSEDGRSVDVRITLDPTQATSALNLSASTTNLAAVMATNIFERYFSNGLMTIALGQQGGFGIPVEIAAKLNPELDTDNLAFYSYDKATNTYRQIKKPSYWVDKNGYVHFTTTLSDNIIISEGALAKL